MALNGLICADMPLSNYSLTHPYDTPYSTKDDERDLRVQGTAHVPNTYMKLSDTFPSAQTFKTLLCNKATRGGCRS